MNIRRHIFADMYRKNLTRSPFVFICIALIVGVTVSRITPLTLYVLPALGIIGISAVIAIVLSIKIPVIQSAVLWFWFFVFGFCFLKAYNSSFYELFGSHTIEAEIINAPQEKPKTYKCEILTSNPKTKSIVYIQKDSLSAQLCMGDLIQLSGTFNEIENTAESTFDYKAYLENKHIFSQAYIPAKHWEKIGHHTSLQSIAIEWRKKMVTQLTDNPLLHGSSSTLAALVFGDTSLLESGIIQAYSATGAMHILSVSGLHVGIIAGMVLFLLSFIPQRFRLLKIFIALTCIWLYAFVTGLVPPVFRAAAMFSIISIGSCLNRSASMYNSLAVAAVVSIIMEPNCVVDIGFQLSYLAVISIAYFGNTIQKLLHFENKIYAYIWGIVAVSIAVQIITLPITMYYFAVVPSYTLLTNIVVVPLSFVVVLLCVATLIIGSIPLIGAGLAWLLNYSCEYLDHVISSIASFPYAQIPVSVSKVGLVLMLFLVLCSMIVLDYRRELRIVRMIEEE
ncbi:MAG: ComEC family competence protein [Bacteroidales bacterium]|jgi:competence protein ComEC|nr:ComEC family competence protein [Bacteroidales bacterium]